MLLRILYPLCVSRADRTDNEEESLNTLFARTILLSFAVLLAVRAGVMLLDASSAVADHGYILQTTNPDTPSGLDGSLDFPAQAPVDLPSAYTTPMPIATRFDLAARPKIVDIRSTVYSTPSAGGFVNASESTLLPTEGGLQESEQEGSQKGVQNSAQWSDTDAPSMPDSRAAVAGWLAALALLALAGAGVWHMKRPLRNMTRAARESANGRHCASMIREEGPNELRRVIRTFNEMLRRRNEAIEEQAVTLAALARHMEEQAARLHNRALDVSEWHQRVAFVEDIDAFADIAQHLLDVVGRGEKNAQTVSVDGFLRDRYSMLGTMDQTLFACDLKAGPQFVMSRPLLERLMTNLVDNALEHGAPPVEILTARDQGGWRLTVRDHGAGIAEHALPSATQAFVRLGHEPCSTQHWGLGLAVVARLARRCGANLELGNHPDGGLCVRLALPAA